MKYLDLFSGYGGFSLGIKQAYENINRQELSKQDQNIRKVVSDGQKLRKRRQQDATCIGYSEIDKYAIQIYKHKFPNHKPYGDITKLDPSTLPDFDLLCGGFPCQAFSIAGKRAGFEDTRGTLIYDVFRIVKEKHPRLVLLENVKGLLSHDGGRTFKTIITSLAELGYAIEWQVLNAKDFGVPQNRERVYIVGHLGGFGGKQIFPIGSDAYISDQADQPNETQSQTEIASTIRTKEGTRSDDNFVIVQRARGKNSGGEKTICPTVSSHAFQDNNHVMCIAERGRYNSEGKTEQKIEPRKDFITNTLTSVEKDNRLSDGKKIRRLTPIECERLMGLPDQWTEGVSDTQRYKLCGNGVVVNVVEEIIKRLI